ncbi:hypothetical protein ACN263_26170 [Micromonospora sp. WMMD729]|uniref:hypothetical protein n=1 Tax=Micromonospora sp. WMMD729 TaxID=3404127 RepID=UPI003BF4BDA9
MAYRTWGRLLLTALGVSVLAGAGQLGVAYGFGIVRLTGAFTGSTVNQWPAQLVWVGWFAANAAVAGAVLTGRLARRDVPPASTGRHLAIGGAAALGATAVAPLCMQPARAAELISVDPVWAVGICAILGAVIGAGAAIAVLLRPELGWNMAAVAGTIWLLALVSVLPSLGTTGPLPTVRLGVLEPNWLDDAAAQRLALLVLPLVALLAGTATAGLARWRGQLPLISAATGVAGPVLVAFAYLTAGPGDAVDRYQTTPYYGALIAVLAGALGAAAAALLRWPLGVRAAGSEAIAPTDILRPLPTGPTLPGDEPVTSADGHPDTEPVDGQLAGTGPGPRAGADTAGVRTVPAHWDWPSITASGQHGPAPADAVRGGTAAPSAGTGQRADAGLSAGDAATTEALADGERYDRTPDRRASWLTDPTGEFTAGRQPSRRDAEPTAGAVEPMPTVPASAAPVSGPGATAGVSPRPDADDDKPTGGDATRRDESDSDRTAASTPAGPLTTGSVDTAVPDDSGTPDSGGADSPTTDPAVTPGTGATVTPDAKSAGTSGTDRAAGDGTVEVSTPKPRRPRKAKSVPTATPADTATDDAAATDGTTTDDAAAADGTTATDETAAPTGVRARRATRAGKGTTSADAARPLDRDASTPDQTAPSPEPAARTGGDPRAEAAGAGSSSATSPDTPVRADDAVPTPTAGAGRTDPAEDGPGGSLFGAVAGADRWTPAAPTWAATSSGPTAAADPEPSAANASDDAPESTDRMPRFRHRPPLPDLSRVPSWDAFDTTRRTRTTDPGTGTSDPSGSSARATGKPDPATGTTGPASSTIGPDEAASALAALARSIVPPSIPPVLPEQGGASTTAGTPEGDTGGTSTDDARQSSRRGRLGGLFRRNRARTDEESRTAPDAAEPLPAQDEEFVDWVAGLGKPVTDNEPEQESGRRSLRSTGRHHRD